MRAVCAEELRDFANFHLVTGNAENTTLAPASVDYVTVAQAFHWFDADRFAAECRRILRKDGKAVLLWNSRDSESAFKRELSHVLAAHCPDYHGFNNGLIRDDAGFAAYMDALDRLFDASAENGILTISNHTVAYIGSIG